MTIPTAPNADAAMFRFVCQRGLDPDVDAELRQAHRRIAIPCVGMIYSGDRQTAGDGSFILAALAALHSDHPDYRQEWRL